MRHRQVPDRGLDTTPGKAARLACRLAEAARRAAARPLAAPIALAVLTLAVWARTFAVPVHDWDDRVYLFEDPRLERPSAANVWRIFTRSFFANYHPVATLTYLFDRTVWGSWAPGFHLTHLAFYAAGAIVVYFLFVELLRSRSAAFAAAAMYAVHAIHTEPVAWLAQRKDVVCLPFYAGALLAYARYTAADGSRARRLYAAALALSVAAMLSKGYAVVLPAAFAAFDLCYAARLGRRQVLDKLPFAALAAGAVALTVLAQDKDSALISLEMTPWQRLVLLSKVFAVYIARAILPIRLSASYEVSHEWLGWPGAAAGFLLAALAVAGFVLLRRRVPAAALGIALFVLPLATVMNVFFTLRTWIADRYLFFPTIGSCLALAAAAMRPSAGPPSRVRVSALVPSAAVLVVALYSALAVERTGVWTSGVRLWSDVLRKRLDLPGSGPVRARDLRGKALGDLEPLMALARAWEREGNPSEAQELLEGVSHAAPSSGLGGELDLARLELEAGRPEEALRRLAPIAESGGWLAPAAWEWIAAAHEKAGRLDAARTAYAKALELYRASGRSELEALLGLAALEFRAREYARAAALYGRARELAPRETRAVFFLGRCLEESGRTADAYALYAEALELGRASTAPGGLRIADIHLQMGLAAEKLGRAPDALAHFEEVLRLDSAHPQREGVRAKLEELRRRAPGQAR